MIITEKKPKNERKKKGYWEGKEKRDLDCGESCLQEFFSFFAVCGKWKPKLKGNWKLIGETKK